MGAPLDRLFQPLAGLAPMIAARITNANCNFLQKINLVLTSTYHYLVFNSSCPRNLRHFGNPKNENLLRSPKFYEENEFPVEMCISQLITEILSFFCFHKNFMTNLSFKIAKKPSWVQHF